MQVTETKVNCQPNHKYMATSGERVSVLVDSGVEVSDVNKKWVMKRITAVISSILAAAGMDTVAGLIFSYNSYMSLKMRSTMKTLAEVMIFDLFISSSSHISIDFFIIVDVCMSDTSFSCLFTDAMVTTVLYGYAVESVAGVGVMGSMISS
ncbi:hypothetical protein MMC13_004963 [Lambiella insularis]|nr:hypothetical protein [Lambiella insularis]